MRRKNLSTTTSGSFGRVRTFRSRKRTPPSSAANQRALLPGRPPRAPLEEPARHHGRLGRDPRLRGSVGAARARRLETEPSSPGLGRPLHLGAVQGHRGDVSSAQGGLVLDDDAVGLAGLGGGARYRQLRRSLQETDRRARHLRHAEPDDEGAQRLGAPRVDAPRPHQRRGAAPGVQGNARTREASPGRREETTRRSKTSPRDGRPRGSPSRRGVCTTERGTSQDATVQPTFEGTKVNRRHGNLVRFKTCTIDPRNYLAVRSLKYLSQLQYRWTSMTPRHVEAILDVRRFEPRRSRVPRGLSSHSSPRFARDVAFDAARGSRGGAVLRPVRVFPHLGAR